MLYSPYRSSPPHVRGASSSGGSGGGASSSGGSGGGASSSSSGGGAGSSGGGSRPIFPCTQREGRVTIKAQYVSCCLSSTDVPRLTEQTIPVYYRVRRHWVSLTNEVYYVFHYKI